MLETVHGWLMTPEFWGLTAVLPELTLVMLFMMSRVHCPIPVVQVYAETPGAAPDPGVVGPWIRPGSRTTAEAAARTMGAEHTAWARDLTGTTGRGACEPHDTLRTTGPAAGRGPRNAAAMGVACPTL